MTCIQLMMIINQLLLQDFFCLWTCIGRSYKSYRGYSSTSCSWWWVQMSSVLIPTWGHSGCWNSTVHNVSHICHMLVNSIHYPQPPPPPPILNSSGYFGFFWCNPFFCWDSIAILGFFGVIHSFVESLRLFWVFWSDFIRKDAGSSLCVIAIWMQCIWVNLLYPLIGSNIC